MEVILTYSALLEAEGPPRQLTRTARHLQVTSASDCPVTEFSD